MDIIYLDIFFLLIKKDIRKEPINISREIFIRFRGDIGYIYISVAVMQMTYVRVNEGGFEDKFSIGLSVSSEINSNDIFLIHSK